MATRFQLVIDCADPDRLARFWIEALGYQPEPPPAPFASWADYWRDRGLPEEELDLGLDRICDPDDAGPAIWFQIVPETKTIKNRIHLDVRASRGRDQPLADRRRLIDAEAARLVTLGATIDHVVSGEVEGHYGIAMRDPEGNEFDVH